MSTERRQREGMTDEDGEKDPLVGALRESLFKCCDELGVPGCDRCPVRGKCRRLWQLKVDDAIGALNLTEYRRLDQEFYILKLERDRILEKRAKVLATHKPA